MHAYSCLMLSCLFSCFLLIHQDIAVNSINKKSISVFCCSCAMSIFVYASVIHFKIFSLLFFVGSSAQINIYIHTYWYSCHDEKFSLSNCFWYLAEESNKQSGLREVFIDQINFNLILFRQSSDPINLFRILSHSSNSQDHIF